MGKRVEYETANLAKEKLFGDFESILISDSTQSELQTWLREVHKIHVFIGYRMNVQKWDSHAYDLTMTGPIYAKSRTFSKFIEQTLYDTYEDALEAGLIEALNKIIIESNG